MLASIPGWQVPDELPRLKFEQTDSMFSNNSADGLDGAVLSSARLRLRTSSNAALSGPGTDSTTCTIGVYEFNSPGPRTQ